MARKPPRVVIPTLFLLCGMLGLLSACATIAGFGRDITGTSNWVSRQIGGEPSATASSRASSASGSSAAPVAATAMTEDQARRTLQNHGYTGISNLHPSGSDWVGAATDSAGKPVSVVVSRSGTVLTAP